MIGGGEAAVNRDRVEGAISPNRAPPGGSVGKAAGIGRKSKISCFPGVF
jgi:hypothetical protein